MAPLRLADFTARLKSLKNAAKPLGLSVTDGLAVLDKLAPILRGKKIAAEQFPNNLSGPIRVLLQKLPSPTIKVLAAAFQVVFTKHILGPLKRRESGGAELRKCLEMTDHILQSVMGYLEEPQKESSLIGSLMYPTLCSVLIDAIGYPVLPTWWTRQLCNLISDSAGGCKANIELLRSKEVLGPQVLAGLLSQAKDFLVLEAILEILTNVIPVSGDSVKQTFLDRFRKGLAINKDLANDLESLLSSKSPLEEWDEVSTATFRILAESHLDFPQLMVVNQISTCGRILKLQEPHNLVFIDSKNFIANIHDKDGEINTFRHPLAGFTEITGGKPPTQTNESKMTIKVSLKEPPTIDGQMLPVPAGETPSLVFQIDDKALTLFKSTISSRGLGHLLNFNAKPRLSVVPSVKCATPVHAVQISEASKNKSETKPTIELLHVDLTSESPTPTPPNRRRPEQKPAIVLEPAKKTANALVVNQLSKASGLDNHTADAVQRPSSSGPDAESSAAQLSPPLPQAPTPETSDREQRLRPKKRLRQHVEHDSPAAGTRSAKQRKFDSVSKKETSNDSQLLKKSPIKALRTYGGKNQAKAIRSSNLRLRNVPSERPPGANAKETRPVLTKDSGTKKDRETNKPVAKSIPKADPRKKNDLVVPKANATKCEDGKEFKPTAEPTSLSQESAIPEPDKTAQTQVVQQSAKSSQSSSESIGDFTSPLAEPFVQDEEPYAFTFTQPRALRSERREMVNYRSNLSDDNPFQCKKPPTRANKAAPMTVATQSRINKAPTAVDSPVSIYSSDSTPFRLNDRDGKPSTHSAMQMRRPPSPIVVPKDTGTIDLTGESEEERHHYTAQRKLIARPGAKEVDFSIEPRKKLAKMERSFLSPPPEYISPHKPQITQSSNSALAQLSGLFGKKPQNAQVKTQGVNRFVMKTQESNILFPRRNIEEGKMYKIIEVLSNIQEVIANNIHRKCHTATRAAGLVIEKVVLEARCDFEEMARDIEQCFHNLVEQKDQQDGQGETERKALKELCASNDELTGCLTEMLEEHRDGSILGRLPALLWDGN